MRPALAIIKKNLLSIICGVIALAAVIAVFWPISGYFATLQTLVHARASAYTTAKSLLTKPRTLPVLDPLSTDAAPLTVFPTDAVIHRGTLAQTAIHDESGKMLDTATKMIVHQPLVPNALPNGGTADATSFRLRYQEIMTYPSSDLNQLQFTLPITILHAGTPPLDADIKAQQDLVKDQITAQKTQKDTTGSPINAAEVTQEVAQAMDEVPSDMRIQAARQNQMYIEKDAFHINQSLTGTSTPTTVAMFNGQMGLWLLQDVFTALASANADCKDGVPGSRVKHLIKIDYADDSFKPNYTVDPSATPPPADPLHPPRMLNLSPTGHVSNGLYDVIPFNLYIVVDAAQVPAVLEALSKDRFIAVLRMDLLTVDSGQAILNGYVYGDKPVVRLNLSCEELFFRADTLPYMPDSIKKALGVAPPPAPAAP